MSLHTNSHKMSVGTFVLYFYIFPGKQAGKRKLLECLTWHGTGSAVMGSHYVWQKVMVRSCLASHVLFVCFYTKLFPCVCVHDIVVCTLPTRFIKFCLSRRPENSDWILTFCSIRKCLWDAIITKIFVSKITLHNYFILTRAELCLNSSSIPNDGSDIHIFPTVRMVKTNFQFENLWISGPSLILRYTGKVQM